MSAEQRPESAENRQKGIYVELRKHDIRKYPPTSALLASSAGLGWSTISVELRSHGVSEVPAFVPQHVEVCLVVAGNSDGLVRRTAAGLCQEAMPTTGAIWLSPAGDSKGIEITAPIPRPCTCTCPQRCLID